MTLSRSSMAERLPVKEDVEGSTPSGTAKHSDLLGMNVATATARLKKSVYLDLLHRLGEDECFRCGEPIDNPDDLSLDHKSPWRFESTELFWDLDNIAHSHRKCNKVDRPKRKIGPKGTSWCGTHKKFLPVESFGVNTERWNGLSTICLACDHKRQARYAKASPRFPCPKCRYQMRKKCQKCGYTMPMKEYMALRRKEGVKY